MKSVLSLIVLSLFVVSCGSNPPPAPPAPPLPANTVPSNTKGWLQPQWDRIVSNCTANGPRAYPQYNASQWATYCPCVSTLIVNIATPQQWDADPYGVLNQINSQQTDQACQDKAFGQSSTTPHDVYADNVMP
ncbi:MAG: hypothetical protein HYR96_07520 [Deltaproteobacteria bacterium]|nr:hypothetical protein [Deltaproteobacteria bacterium]MBI3296306.1 hypothetical protein [Deltaproteobacteria bacterium]